MVHVNLTPEEVLNKIINEVSDQENDDIEVIASLASDDEIDVAPAALSTSFSFDDPDNVNGVDQNVTGNDDNASSSIKTTQRPQLTRDRLSPYLESVRCEQNYNPVGLPTIETNFTSDFEKPKPSNSSG